MDETITVGVVGLGRGRMFAGSGAVAGMKLVALCDLSEQRLASAGRALGVATYTDYERFLSHEMDAVVLANYFHQHTPLAISALRAGKHVMSETSACLTLAQGVDLVREVERSGKVYMLAENYPYMVFNQEMRRLYQAGTIGDFRYGEGEYVHTFSARDFNLLAPGADHWRNWLPGTYYSTHSLAPLMFITDTRPVSVNGFIIPYDRDDPQQTMTMRRSDPASVILIRMDNGATVKLIQFHVRGDGVWVRVHGNRGQMENMRSGDRNRVRLRREPFDAGPDADLDRVWLPRFPEFHDEAVRAGHGGGDLFVNLEFARAIRERRQPYFDVSRAVAMSIVGPQAYRSALEGGAPVAVPDLTDPAEQSRYESDTWSPDPADRGPGQPWPSILGPIEPGPEARGFAEQLWAEQAARAGELFVDG